tara:strand:+ start:47 stop:247 length:201 start_codon:yes stop_codon:yes gene_type:complete
MNTATKRQYFTLCPALEETKYIYLEYEDYRRRMVVSGNKPPSLSRYLINIILEHYKSQSKEGLSNG